MRRLVLMLMLGLASRPGAAHAGDQDFTLVNRTGLRIDQVYVSRDAHRSWGGDVMGRDALADGHSVDISFNAPERACRWDLKVTYQAGDSVVWSGLNLCSINKVSLYRDRRREITRAVTE